MAELLDDVSYLSQEVGPRPAGTEEEQQAALYIADQVHQRTGFHAELEDISCMADAELVDLIYFAVAFLCLLLAFLVPATSIVTLVLSAIAAVLYFLERVGKRSILARLLTRDISQNVVVKYKPGTDSARAIQSRKIVVVTNYDSGRIRREAAPRVVGVATFLAKAAAVSLIATPFLILLRNIVLAGSLGVVNAVLSLLCVVALVFMGIELLLLVLHRFSAFNEAANNNAAGVAVMLEVLRRIDGTAAPENAPRPRTARAEQAQPPAIHGERAARKAGVVPEGAALSYDGDAVPKSAEPTGPEDEAPAAPAYANDFAAEPEPGAPEDAPAVEQNRVVPQPVPDDASPEARLRSAKAAIAALTGEAVRDDIFLDLQPEPKSAPAPAPISEPSPVPAAQESQPQPDQAPAAGEPAVRPVAGEPATATYPEPAAAGPAPAAGEPVPAEYDVPQKPPVPDWFASAQAKANRPMDTPVRRSRYADAIDTAMRESQEHFRRANSLVDEETENRLRQMRESFAAPVPQERPAVGEQPETQPELTFAPVPEPELSSGPAPAPEPAPVPAPAVAEPSTTAAFPPVAGQGEAVEFEHEFDLDVDDVEPAPLPAEEVPAKPAAPVVRESGELPQDQPAEAAAEGDDDAIEVPVELVDDDDEYVEYVDEEELAEDEYADYEDEYDEYEAAAPRRRSQGARRGGFFARLREAVIPPAGPVREDEGYEDGYAGYAGEDEAYAEEPEPDAGYDAEPAVSGPEPGGEPEPVVPEPEPGPWEPEAEPADEARVGDIGEEDVAVEELDQDGYIDDEDYYYDDEPSRFASLRDRMSGAFSRLTNRIAPAPDYEDEDYSYDENDGYGSYAEYPEVVDAPVAAEGVAYDDEFAPEEPFDEESLDEPVGAAEDAYETAVAEPAPVAVEVEPEPPIEEEPPAYEPAARAYEPAGEAYGPAPAADDEPADDTAASDDYHEPLSYEPAQPADDGEFAPEEAYGEDGYYDDWEDEPERPSLVQRVSGFWNRLVGRDEPAPEDEGEDEDYLFDDEEAPDGFDSAEPAPAAQGPAGVRAMEYQTAYMPKRAAVTSITAAPAGEPAVSERAVRSEPAASEAEAVEPEIVRVPETAGFPDDATVEPVAEVAPEPEPEPVPEPEPAVEPEPEPEPVAVEGSPSLEPAPAPEQTLLEDMAYQQVIGQPVDDGREIPTSIPAASPAASQTRPANPRVGFRRRRPPASAWDETTAAVPFSTAPFDPVSPDATAPFEPVPAEPAIEEPVSEAQPVAAVTPEGERLPLRNPEDGPASEPQPEEAPALDWEPAPEPEPVAEPEPELEPAAEPAPEAPAGFAPAAEAPAEPEPAPEPEPQPEPAGELPVEPAPIPELQVGDEPIDVDVDIDVDGTIAMKPIDVSALRDEPAIPAVEPAFEEAAAELDEPTPAHRVKLPEIPLQTKQHAPLAQAADEDGRVAAKSRLSSTIPTIDIAKPEPEPEPAASPYADGPSRTERMRALRSNLPSMSGRISGAPLPGDSGNNLVSQTGSFAAVSATGNVDPVGDELVEDIPPEEIYVDDVDDSLYEEGGVTETGAYTAPDYVQMPEKRRGLFGRRRNRRDEDEMTPQQWLGVSDDFDARAVGKARGDWSSFQENDARGTVGDRRAPAEPEQPTMGWRADRNAPGAPSDYDTGLDSAFNDEEDDFLDSDYGMNNGRWNGGAFSGRRARTGERDRYDAYDEMNGGTGYDEYAEFAEYSDENYDEEAFLNDLEYEDAPEPQEKGGRLKSLTARFSRRGEGDGEQPSGRGTRTRDGESSRNGRTRRTSTPGEDDAWNVAAARAAARSAVANVMNDPRVQEELGETYGFVDDPIANEVWFVALGAGGSGNAGMQQFLDEHADELRGAVIISLEGIGDGELAGMASEGLLRQYKPTTRMKRFLRNAGQATGIRVGQARMNWRDSAAAEAMRRGFSAITVAGVEGNVPVRFASSDDVVDNLSEDTLKQRVNFILELLRTI